MDFGYLPLFGLYRFASERQSAQSIFKIGNSIFYIYFNNE
ncbi:hypothetical protein C943_03214 [Mariniradius saccharolyticus AK6]|uniref:Uncharacterized protein n=1 Tax=Mariniradius saccharolyticus AK6 TaxID=1239962 RepID=M7Y2C6_9BACT|nr:hypothetical protein C943_03214 [Mariniradius saccharolyticus AK6]